MLCTIRITRTELGVNGIHNETNDVAVLVYETLITHKRTASDDCDNTKQKSHRTRAHKLTHSHTQTKMPPPLSCDNRRRVHTHGTGVRAMFTPLLRVHGAHFM